MNLFIKCFKKIRVTAIISILLLSTLPFILCSCDPISILLFGFLISPYNHYVNMDPIAPFYFQGQEVKVKGDCFIAGLLADGTLLVEIKNSNGYTVLSKYYANIEGNQNYELNYTAEASGHYKAIAKLDWTWFKSKSAGYSEASGYFAVIDGSGGDGNHLPYTLTKWCGENTKGFEGQEMKYPVSHPIAVEVTGATSIQSVSFITEEGDLIDPSGIYSSNIINGLKQIDLKTTSKLVDGSLREIAIVYYKAPDNLTVSAKPEIITCKLIGEDDTNKEIQYTVYALKDNELSNLTGGYTHQKFPLPSTNEVPGDNLKDAYLCTDSKDILIEMDWYQWESGITKGDIDDIAKYVKEILLTAKINADIKVEDNAIEAANPRLDRIGRMAKLYDKRTYKDFLSTMGCRLHVIIGGEPNDVDSDDWLGKVDNGFLAASGSNFYLTSWNNGSGPNAQNHKDSTGCWVFANRIKNDPNRVVPWSHAIALCAAHEIGHALGMWHIKKDIDDYEVKNIMHPALNLADPLGYTNFGIFYLPKLDGTGDMDDVIWDGMNTRHILGVDCNNYFENN